jgi:hypothetical protein
MRPLEQGRAGQATSKEEDHSKEEAKCRVAATSSDKIRQ